MRLLCLFTGHRWLYERLGFFAIPIYRCRRCGVAR